MACRYNHYKKHSGHKIVAISRLRFGRACFHYHLHRIGFLLNNLCEDCNDVCDTDHLFLEFYRYRTESNILMTTLIPLDTELLVSTTQ